MAEMSKEVQDLFNNPEASKVLATVDTAGNLNVVPKGTVSAVGADTIAFAELVGGKTKANLESVNKAAVTVFKMSMPPSGYQVKGTFQGFQTSGPLFDKFASMVKQMLKIDIQSVGTIKVEEVYSVSPADAGKKLS